VAFLGDLGEGLQGQLPVLLAHGHGLDGAGMGELLEGGLAELQRGGALGHVLDCALVVPEFLEGGLGLGGIGGGLGGFDEVLGQLLQGQLLDGLLRRLVLEAAEEIDMLDAAGGGEAVGGLGILEGQGQEDVLVVLSHGTDGGGAHGRIAMFPVGFEEVHESHGGLRGFKVRPS
jgi:hypothetical protein